MQAILEQATDEATTSDSVPSVPLPTVTYNREGKVIIATVVISPISASPTYEHQIPPICIPKVAGLSWTVIWNLVTVGGLTAAFESEGIDVPEKLPEGIRFSGATTLQPPVQCLARISNDVLALEFFSYNLVLSVTDPQGNPLAPAVRFHRIDPTIVVTPDPIDSIDS